MPTQPKSSLVLVGMMGCGKSTIGQNLAKRTKLPFKDSDEIIQIRQQTSIADIFNNNGEKTFRDIETKIITEILTAEPCVLAAGGGAFMQNQIQKLCSRYAISIYLKTPLQTLWERVRDNTHRPLVQQGYTPFKTLYRQRSPIYEKADITIPCQDKNKTQITNDILKTLKDSTL